MTQALPAVNGDVAPLRNVTLLDELVKRVMNRPPHLPGLGCFYGHSGYGKTVAATRAVVVNRAVYVEVGESWTRKKLCTALLRQVGVPAKRTVADMIEQIIDCLCRTKLPVLVDEADHLARKGMIEVVREIHDKSGASIVLIGEEMLPELLARWERVDNRVLDWVPAQPASLEDTRHLARLYCPGVEIGPDLLAKIHEAGAGRVRRICVNLERARERAVLDGLEVMGLAQWGDEPFFSGRPPARRR